MKVYASFIGEHNLMSHAINSAVMLLEKNLVTVWHQTKKDPDELAKIDDDLSKIMQFWKVTFY